MTRDEMIGAISHAIVVGESNYIPSKVTAEAILNTIFAALKEPTEEMRERGYDAIGDEDLNPTTLGMNQLWQAMLTASPLAPEGERE